MVTERRDPDKPRRAQSSAILPSVKTQRTDASETPTQRSNISDILRIPRPGPYFKIITAASAALTSRSMVATAAALFPLYLVSGFIASGVRRMEAGGPRDVLELLPRLLDLIAAAGALSVSAICARKRVEGIAAKPKELAGWWVGSLPVSFSLPLAFGIAYIAFKGILYAMTRVDGWGLFRIVPLAMSATMVACLAALAVAATYVSAIRAIENVDPGESVGVLSGLLRRSRAPLLLHFTVIALAAGGYWVASDWLVSRIYLQAAMSAPADTTLWTLYDDALFRTLSQAPPLAMLGSFGVASHLLLRQGEETHGVD